MYLYSFIHAPLGDSSIKISGSTLLARQNETVNITETNENQQTNQNQPPHWKKINQSSLFAHCKTVYQINAVSSNQKNQPRNK